MGRAKRWFLGLLGGKKPADGSKNGPPKERRRWGFVKSFREKEKTQPPDREKGDAIAVAVATASVTLKSRSRPAGLSVRVKPEESAATIIQSAFRGYLARRALKALRGLVKLQALVRGNIVRKQAAETLRCMQALVRVQAHARTCRALHSETTISSRSSRSNNQGPRTPEKCESAMRSTASCTDRSASLKKKSSKKTRSRNHSEHWNSLDQWMEDRCWADEKNAKVLEVDNGKPSPPNPKRRTDSPSKDSTTAQLSIPSPSSSVDMSPRFFSTISRRDYYSKSLFSEYSDYPSYMANTESSRAKARSQSAPRQRPEFDKSGSIKRLSGQGLAGHNKPSLHSKFVSKAYPGSGRLDRLGMPVRV